MFIGMGYLEAFMRVRIQVAVRDPGKIPEDTIAEIQQDLYLLTFTVEKDDIGPSSHNPSGPGDDDSDSKTC